MVTEADLIKARTREGMAVARVAGKLRGRKPQLTPAREALLVELQRNGQKTPSDLDGYTAAASSRRSR